MKRNIITFSLLLTAGLLASCTAGSASKAGKDANGNNIATNPYRDTFATTSTYGNATTVDNSGSGGVHVAKPKASGVPTAALPAASAPAAPADTAKK